MTPEIYTNGKELLFTNRRRPPAIQPLGKKQIAWLESKFPGISRNRVSRLADHERAFAAYMRAMHPDEASNRMEKTT